MKGILVAFQSKYGSTRRYAEWIAAELGADLKERRDVTPAMLHEYDCVVYGGGLYASGISGVSLVTKNPCDNLVVFAVGASNPENTDYAKVIEQNFPTNAHKPLKVFHLRGALDYAKLGIAHKGVMAMIKKMAVDKKRPEDWTAEERIVAETYGKRADFIDRDTITPLVGYVRGLQKKMKARN